MLAITGITSGFAEDILTVDEAAQMALDNNLGLLRSSLEVRTRRRTADRSWNSLLPTVSAAALISHPTSITGPIEGDSRNVWTPGFSLSANLTLSVSIIDTIKKARTDYEIGLLTYEAACQELELSVRKLFYQILLLDANREMADQNVASAQERYEQSAALVRMGQAPRLDELSARVDLETLRPTARNARMLYENTLDSFKTILGIPLETEIVLDGSITEGIVSWTADIITTELHSSNSWNLADSLEAISLRKAIQSLEAQRNGIRNGAYIPNLRLSWSSTPLYAIRDATWSDTGSFSISLGLNIDSFLPWSTVKTQMDNLGDSIHIAQIQLTDALRNRENSIRQTMRTVERIAESLEALTLNVELAESTYLMYQDAYRRGAADYQQLRSAGDSLEQAKNRLLQEQYNMISALLDLEKELNIPFGTLWQ